jgi:hypothetical protein
MTKKKHDEPGHGITRREVIKGVGAGAAGLALMRDGAAQGGESRNFENEPKSPAGETTAGSRRRDSSPSPDDVEEVLGFISPTYAIPFKIPRP